VTSDLLSERLPHTDDDRIDTAAVRRALGPRWADIVRGRHLGAKAATWARLASLLAVSEDELMAHVDRARKAKRDREWMVYRCRSFPFRLQTWEQVEMRLPCPGCGHPWPAPDTPAARRQYERSHRDCCAGGTGFAECRRHCNRCCGVPPLSPSVRARVDALIAQAVADQERKAATTGPSAQERAERRASEIARLERRLDRLREEQASDLGDR
jgi:hypothetical protein